MLAEAARIQAEIDKQAAEKEYNNKSQTAVLYACKMREAEDENSKKEINTNKNNALENKDKNISIASRKTISPKIPLVIAGIFTIGALGVLKVLKKV